MNTNHAMQCYNCRTNITPLWRRGENGKYLCNACGLYFKIHRMNRPHTMKSESFRHRQRMRKNDLYDDYQGQMMNKMRYEDREYGYQPIIDTICLFNENGCDDWCKVHCETTRYKRLMAHREKMAAEALIMLSRIQ